MDMNTNTNMKEIDRDAPQVECRTREGAAPSATSIVETVRIANREAAGLCDRGI